MIFNIESEDDFRLVARSFYNNGSGNREVALKTDLRLITNLQTQISRYLSGGKHNLNLMLNHFIVLNNVFGVATIPLIKSQLKPTLHTCVDALARIVGMTNSKEYNIDLYNAVMKEIE